MSAISDFNDTELWVVPAAVNERYGKGGEPQRAHIEPRPDPGPSTPTASLPVFWSERGARFAMGKIGESRFARRPYRLRTVPSGRGTTGPNASRC